MRLPLAGRGRASVVLLGWITAAAVAGSIGVAAIGAVGDGIVGSSTTPLSAQQVEDDLAASGTPGQHPTTPAPTGQPTTSPPASTSPVTQAPAEQSAMSETKIISTSRRGSIVTRCQGASPLIVSATPPLGYQVDKDADEGEGRARVRFESDAEDVRIEVEIFCVDGVPTWTEEVD